MSGDCGNGTREQTESAFYVQIFDGRVPEEGDLRNMLTMCINTGYTESLKTSSAAFAPRQRVFFMPVILWGMRAENNQYQPKPSELAFSESPANSFFGGLLKKVQKMTNTIINTTESTLQSLYRYYTEMKSSWYKGKYTNEQEELYFRVFQSLEDALLKLPAQSAIDYKIKLSMLKRLIQFPLETNHGIDLNLAENREIEALDLIEQIAGE